MRQALSWFRHTLAVLCLFAASGCGESDGGSEGGWGEDAGQAGGNAGDAGGVDGSTGDAVAEGATCQPDCTGRTCGPDPVCNQSCGTCGDRVCTHQGECGVYLWMHDAVGLTPPSPAAESYPEYMQAFPVVFAQENKSLQPVENFGYLAAVDGQGFGPTWNAISEWQNMYPEQTFAVWHISFEYQAAVGNNTPGNTGSGLLFDGVSEATGEELADVPDAKWYGARGVFAGHWLYRAGTYTTTHLSDSGTTVKVQDPAAIKVGGYVVVRKGRRRAASPPGGDWGTYVAGGEWAEAEFMEVSQVNGDGTVVLTERGYSGSRGMVTSARKAHPVDSYMASVVTGQAGPKTWRWNCARSWCPRDKSGQTMNDWLTKYYWDIYMRVGGTGTPIDPATRVAGFFWDIDDSDLNSAYHGPPDADNDGVAEGGWDSATGANRYGQGQKDFNEGLVQYFENHEHPLAPYLPFVYMGAIGSQTDRGTCGYQAEQAFLGFDVFNGDPAGSNLYRGDLDQDLCRLKWQVGHVGHGPAGSQVLLKNATEKYSVVKGQTVVVPSGKGEQTARFSLAMATAAGAAFSHMNWYTDPDRFHDEYSVDVNTGATATTNQGRYMHRFWLGTPLDTYYRVEGAQAKYAIDKNMLSNPLFESDVSGYTAVDGIITRSTQQPPWDGNTHGVSLHYTGGGSLALPTHDFKQGVWYTLAIAARADLRAPSCDGALKKIVIKINGAAAPTRSVFFGTQWSVALVSFLWRGEDATSSIKLEMGKYSCPSWFGGFLLFEGTNANVFRRDFEHGTVLVNATESPVTIDLTTPHHHIKGVVDSDFNDGKKNVTSVALGKYDARFLVRP